MTHFLRQIPKLALLIPALILFGFGASVLVSELAWASSHKDWPRPLASLIGLLALGVGGTLLWWLVWGRA